MGKSSATTSTANTFFRFERGARLSLRRFGSSITHTASQTLLRSKSSPGISNLKNVVYVGTLTSRCRRPASPRYCLCPAHRITSKILRGWEYRFGSSLHRVPHGFLQIQKERAQRVLGSCCSCSLRLRWNMMLSMVFLLFPRRGCPLVG